MRQEFEDCVQYNSFGNGWSTGSVWGSLTAPQQLLAVEATCSWTAAAATGGVQQPMAMGKKRKHSAFNNTLSWGRRRRLDIHKPLLQTDRRRLRQRPHTSKARGRSKAQKGFGRRRRDGPRRTTTQRTQAPDATG